MLSFARSATWRRFVADSVRTVAGNVFDGFPSARRAGHGLGADGERVVRGREHLAGTFFFRRSLHLAGGGLAGTANLRPRAPPTRRSSKRPVMTAGP